MFEELGMKWALPILKDAQHEVNLWLVANSIECQPHWDSIDMNVESFGEAFKVKYGRFPDVYAEEAFCDEFWFDPIYLKIRALVKERTSK